MTIQLINHVKSLVQVALVSMVALLLCPLVICQNASGPSRKLNNHMVLIPARHAEATGVQGRQREIVVTYGPGNGGSTFAAWAGPFPGYTDCAKGFTCAVGSAVGPATYCLTSTQCVLGTLVKTLVVTSTDGCVIDFEDYCQHPHVSFPTPTEMRK